MSNIYLTVRKQFKLALPIGAEKGPVEYRTFFFFGHLYVILYSEGEISS
ncbi:MAG: hypothetical protein ACM3UW_01740 [Bacillota bacterium]